MPKFVQVHQNGTDGPLVRVSEDFAKCLDLEPGDPAAATAETKSPASTGAGALSHSGGKTAPTDA